MKAIQIGYIASYSLFFALFGFSFWESHSERKLIELSSESIAPDNLRRVGERFRLSLIVEDQTKEIYDFVTSDSWEELQSRLSAYADRLEMLQDQRRSRRRILNWLYLGSAISMAGFSLAHLRLRNRAAQQGVDRKPDNVPS